MQGTKVKIHRCHALTTDLESLCYVWSETYRYILQNDCYSLL